MGEKFKSGSNIMASFRRRILLLMASRNKVRSLSHSPALLLVLAILLTGVCVFTYSRNEKPVLETLKGEVTVFETPAQTILVENIHKEKELVTEKYPINEVKFDAKLRNVFSPPLPVVSKKNSRKKLQRSDLEDYEDNGNAEPNSMLGRVLSLAGKVQHRNEGGPSLLDSVLKVAKSLKYVSDKVDLADQTIQTIKLKQVQGFVNSAEMKSVIHRNENVVGNVPLGPEARKNAEFEKTMQYQDKKPSFIKSMAQKVGPALLSGIAKTAAKEDASDVGVGGNSGPSFLENLFINVGPQIIEEALGGGNAGDDYDRDEGLSSGGFGKAMKFLGPIVKGVVQSQQGDKGDVNSAVSSLMGVVGGLAPVLQGGANGKMSLGETFNALKPVLSFMGPSILEKIVDSKNKGQKRKERSSHEPLVGASAGHQVPVKEQGTIIDKMLHGMDEKTVGKAVGRALSSVVVKVIPDTVPLPKPSAIRRPYDMALNLVVGNPRNNSKSVWTWLRKMSGESESGNTKPLKWIRDALNSPKRIAFKEDIRHLYGLLESDEQACRDLVEVGGIYDWRKDNILASRAVCEDFDLWKSLTKKRVMLSFGLRDGWSFEEELAKRPNCQIYVVEPSLGMANHNHSEKIAFYKGGLAVDEKGLSQTVGGGVQELLPFSSWLRRWNLTRTPLQFVKVDLGGGEWQVLQSMIDDSARPLEDILQLSVNVELDDALKDPSVYSTHIETLDTLAGLGFQLLRATASPGGESYQEPLLDNRKLPLHYRLLFVRI